MKTKRVHISNFGAFRPCSPDGEGYITYHDSQRYADASHERLMEWMESRRPEVRASAYLELVDRDLDEWRSGDHQGARN